MTLAFQTLGGEQQRLPCQAGLHLTRGSRLPSRKRLTTSFGSQHPCSYSNPSENVGIGRWCTLAGSHLRSLSLRARVFHPNTRTNVRLLGPCYKTGRLPPLRQHPSRCADLGPGRLHSTTGYNAPRREPHSRAHGYLVMVLNCSHHRYCSFEGASSVNSCHYFDDVSLSNFRSCCLPWKWRQCLRPPLRNQTLISRHPLEPLGSKAPQTQLIDQSQVQSVEKSRRPIDQPIYSLSKV